MPFLLQRCLQLFYILHLEGHLEGSVDQVDICRNIGVVQTEEMVTLSENKVKMTILWFFIWFFSVEMPAVQHAGVPSASHRRNGTPKVELTNSARALQRSMGHLEEKSSASRDKVH